MSDTSLQAILNLLAGNREEAKQQLRQAIDQLIDQQLFPNDAAQDVGAPAAEVPTDDVAPADGAVDEPAAPGADDSFPDDVAGPAADDVDGAEGDGEVDLALGGPGAGDDEPEEMDDDLSMEALIRELSQLDGFGINLEESEELDDDSDPLDALTNPDETEDSTMLSETAGPEHIAQQLVAAGVDVTPMDIEQMAETGDVPATLQAKYTEWLDGQESSDINAPASDRTLQQFAGQETDHVSFEPGSKIYDFLRSLSADGAESDLADDVMNFMTGVQYGDDANKLGEAEDDSSAGNPQDWPPLLSFNDDDSQSINPVVEAFDPSKVEALQVVEVFEDDHLPCVAVKATIGGKEYKWTDWNLDTSFLKNYYKSECGDGETASPAALQALNDHLKHWLEPGGNAVSESIEDAHESTHPEQFATGEEFMEYVHNTFPGSHVEHQGGGAWMAFDASDKPIALYNEENGAADFDMDEEEVDEATVEPVEDATIDAEVSEDGVSDVEVPDVDLGDTNADEANLIKDLGADGVDMSGVDMPAIASVQLTGGDGTIQTGKVMFADGSEATFFATAEDAEKVRAGLEELIGSGEVNSVAEALDRLAKTKRLACW